MDTRFLVIDADQPVETLLLLLDSLHPRWIVLRALRGSFFVFSSMELRDLSSIAHGNLNVAAALRLRKQDASQLCSSNRLRKLALRRIPQQPTSKRVVFVNRRGEVTRVGKLISHLTKQRPRVSSGGSSRSSAGITAAQRDRARRAFA